MQKKSTVIEQNACFIPRKNQDGVKEKAGKGANGSWQTLPLNKFNFVNHVFVFVIENGVVAVSEVGRGGNGTRSEANTAMNLIWRLFHMIEYSLNF